MNKFLETHKLPKLTQGKKKKKAWVCIYIYIFLINY